MDGYVYLRVCVFCVRGFLLSLPGGIEKRDFVWDGILAGSWLGRRCAVDTITITLTFWILSHLSVARHIHSSTKSC